MKWLTDVTEFKWYEDTEVHKIYLSAICQEQNTLGSKNLVLFHCPLDGMQFSGRVLGCLFCYRSVWNKRAACIGTMQIKMGLGTAQQAF